MDLPSPRQTIEQMRANVKRVFDVIVAADNKYPGVIELVKALGRKIEGVDFTLDYREIIEELKTKFGIDFEHEALIIVTSRNGYLDIFELLAENEVKEKDYSEVQQEILVGDSSDFFVLNWEEWSELNEQLIWSDYINKTPVEVRIRKFALINPEYNYTTRVETEFIERHTRPARLKMDKKDYLDGMMAVLEEMVREGQYVNYKYLVNGILAFAEKMGVEG
ncbi:MAG: hypothetical protein ACMG57_03660 [Candidatus Dojkabacteria bacterium]